MKMNILIIYIIDMQQNSILEFLFFQDHFSEFAAAIYADLVSQFFS